VTTSFVAVNYIACKPEYAERFEALFKTRARAIDTLPGFIDMQVLKPTEEDGEYLVVSRWEGKEHFDAWVGSPEFLEGHKRGFEDIAAAKRAGEESPMTSTFRTYSVLTD
jgi:heme-degrading monooxygenase HmoA